MTEQNSERNASASVRYLIIAAVVLAGFLGSYAFANARSADDPATTAYVTEAANPAGASTGEAGCSCCGGGSSEPIEGTAVVEADGVQRISVDVSTGYDPNVIKLAAGVPSEITFGQGGGCTAEIMSAELGFFEDLTSGPKTIALPPLEAGTYGFSCGMEMIFGSIVVE